MSVAYRCRTCSRTPASTRVSSGNETGRSCRPGVAADRVAEQATIVNDAISKAVRKRGTATFRLHAIIKKVPYPSFERPGLFGTARPLFQRRPSIDGDGGPLFGAPALPVDT